MTASFQPLTISIVGAGIGGLTAAIALRRNGHHVQIFEAAENKAEILVNVTVQMNALRVLEFLGLPRDNLKGAPWEGAEYFSFDGREQTTYPWLFPKTSANGVICQRTVLYEELKKLAIGEGEGPPAKLRLAAKVIACDVEEGTVTLDGGEVVNADCILGADGIHSVIRNHVRGSIAKERNSGMSCFRAIFDAKNLRDIPALEWVYAGISGTRMVVKDEPFRLLWAYPILGSLISVTGFFADSPDDPGTSFPWTPTVTREEFIAKYGDFDPKFLRVLDLPIHIPITRWTIRVMTPLPNWVRGRVALLGDAAHATTPMLGQGAGMAIEEGVAVGCLLPAGTRREDIPARLEAYQRHRKQRGDRVNTESIEQVSDSQVSNAAFDYLRAEELQRYLIEYDAVKAAKECYQENFGGGSC
ncbi:hypothetical protein K438DRAFT_1963053 [Mycena galopus ATCC 62051]|nr:hypothetical protein K438DRAFT_1963053 [Mycena galopus ATCC 62051]